MVTPFLWELTQQLVLFIVKVRKLPGCNSQG